MSDVIIATPPLFMNQKQAGDYLGHCGKWLRLGARRHDLYKPSIGQGRRGSPALYHRDHINIIAMHMVNAEVFTEDAALLVWRRQQANAVQGYLDSVKTQKKGSSK